MKESTRNIIKMHGRRYDRAAHNFIYFVYYGLYIKYFLVAGRLTIKYLSRVPLIAPIFGFVYARYHAKVITQDDARKILSLKEDIILGPDKTERIIPFKYANNIVFKEPEYIAVMDCPCRASRENPCQPINVCIAVGRTTAQFWLEHGKKYNVRKITQAEALDIMEKAHEQGCITTSFFKVATGGRTGVICQCCTCCCGAMEANRLVKKTVGGEKYRIITPSGYLVEVDEDKCKACGTCVKACSVFYALSQTDGEKPACKVELCHGCGVCVEKCPNGARVLVRDKSATGLVPLDLDLAKEMLG
jgi:Pyruvate/2-oxoacid:ferredoxin oxidoreductase delta subunit